MAGIGSYDEWSIEKDFLTFPICNAMLGPVLADVPVVPIEPFASGKLIERSHHSHCISFQYTSLRCSVAPVCRHVDEHVGDQREIRADRSVEIVHRLRELLGAHGRRRVNLGDDDDFFRAGVQRA